MKALTLTQPWASAIMLGLKAWETRSWPTKYRGPIAIHAAKGLPTWAREFAAAEITLGRLPKRIPIGCVLGVADLTDCRPTSEVYALISAIERIYGDYTPGRFAFHLENVRPFSEPIGATGHLRLWEWEPQSVPDKKED